MARVLPYASRVAGLFLGVLFIALSYGCASLDGLSDGQGTRPRLFVVSGTIDGLDGATLTLLDNGTSPTIITMDGAFAFPRELADGAAYVVSVLATPDGRECAIDRGTGHIAGADVTDVAVHCPSTDAALSSLSVSSGPLAPTFAPTTLAYTTVVALSPLFATTLTVTAKARAAGATITIAGAPVLSEMASAPLAVQGGPNPIDVTVTSANRKVQAHYAIVANGTYLVDYMKASNTQANARFGVVALSGDTLAVGASGEASDGSSPASTSAPQAGAVYVYTRAGSTWSQQAYLKASNPRPAALFGSTLALDGDTLAVGSQGESSDGSGQASTSATNAGAVYVFTRSGTTWSQQAYLKASKARAGAFFGIAVALAGDTLAVGADGETSNATGVNQNQDDASLPGAGATYVFTRMGTTWTQQAYVKASNTRSYANFGSAVALSGDTLAVGSRAESSNATGIDQNQLDTSSNAAGAVYVFTRSGTTWAQQAYVKASNTQPNMFFGNALALSADTLVVGAPLERSKATGVDGAQNDVSATNAGAAYVFVRSGVSWTQQAYLKASNGRVNVAFGESLALAGDTLVVGGPSESSSATGVNGNQADVALPGAGAAYVFTRAGTTWSQRSYVKAPRSSNAGFGGSVALSKTDLAVGALGESSNAVGVNGDQTDASAPQAGAAYVFP